MTEIITITNGELSLTVIDGEIKTTSNIMGGDDRNLSWEDYVNDFKDEYKPHIILIKEAIEKLNWIGEVAGDKANDTSFKFSDGQVWGFSWRAWGDLMQAIVNKNEGYMKYYM